MRRLLQNFIPTENVMGYAMFQGTARDQALTTILDAAYRGSGHDQSDQHSNWLTPRVKSTHSAAMLGTPIPCAGRLRLVRVGEASHRSGFDGIANWSSRINCR